VQLLVEWKAVKATKFIMALKPHDQVVPEQILAQRLENISSIGFGYEIINNVQQTVVR